MNSIILTGQQNCQLSIVNANQELRACRGGYYVKSNMVYTSVRTWYTTYSLLIILRISSPFCVLNSAILKFR